MSGFLYRGRGDSEYGRPGLQTLCQARRTLPELLVFLLRFGGWGKEPGRCIACVSRNGNQLRPDEFSIATVPMPRQTKRCPSCRPTGDGLTPVLIPIIGSTNLIRA